LRRQNIAIDQLPQKERGGFAMPRVYWFPLLLLLSACTATDIQPNTVAHQIGDTLPGKSIVACTGLPMGGEKCGLELPKRNDSAAAG